MSSTTPGGPGVRTELVDRLSELARALQEEADVQGVLDVIVRGAVDTVPGAEHASLSSIRRRQVVETRAATSEDLGALNLFSTVPDAFDEEAEHVALLFAAHAAVAMADAQELERVRSALGTRDTVGQAKGILMERFKLTPDQAFALLVRASQTSNRKLHEVAEELATPGGCRACPRRPGPRSAASSTRRGARRPTSASRRAPPSAPPRPLRWCRRRRPASAAARRTADAARGRARRTSRT